MEQMVVKWYYHTHHPPVVLGQQGHQEGDTGHAPGRDKDNQLSRVLDLQGDLKARRKSNMVDDQHSRQRMSGSAGVPMQGVGVAVPGVVLPSMAPSAHAVDHSNASTCPAWCL